MTGMRMDGGAASPSAAAAFLGMTVAMMLPSLVPTFWRYRQALARAGERRASWMTVVAGTGYFVVWTALGMALFPLGIALATAERKLPALVRAGPVVVGVVVLIAGAVQLTAWKARQLARCREAAGPGHAVPTGAAAAWRHGLRLGRHCGLSCAGPMASLLAIGMMDLRAMAVVTAAITVERLAPAGERVARAIGVGGLAAGAFLVVRAVG
jgi:predicted metal-binding membrane protein